MKYIAGILTAAIVISCNSKNADESYQTLEGRPSLKPVLQEQVMETSTQEDIPTTTIKFDETLYNFGEVTDGDVVSHTYTFTNNGDSDLIISDAKASCGCTVPTFTKEPVKPGEKGEIQVKFNSANRVGNQEKTITVTANTTPPMTQVKLRGVVKPKNS